MASVQKIVSHGMVFSVYLTALVCLYDLDNGDGKRPVFIWFGADGSDCGLKNRVTVRVRGW